MRINRRRTGGRNWTDSSKDQNGFGEKVESLEIELLFVTQKSSAGSNPETNSGTAL